MTTLKEAWELLKLEYKMTPPSYTGAILMLALSLFLAVSSIKNIQDQATVGTEILFFVIVIGFPNFIRSDQLQPKKVGIKDHVSPIIVLLQSMPVAKQTIALYRMLSYVSTTIIFNIVFFTLFYVLSPYIHSSVSLQTYIVFTIMWICFAIYVGGFQVNIEAGYHNISYWIYLFIFWLPVSFIGISLLFYKTYTEGLIQWMLDMSANYPLVVLGASIVLAIIGWMIHVRGFMKRVRTVDY